MGDMVFPGGLRPDGLPAALSAPQRLAAVRATGLLDTGPESPFDDLARLAIDWTPTATKCQPTTGSTPETVDHGNISVHDALP